MSITRWLRALILLPVFMFTPLASAEGVEKVVYNVDFASPDRFSATMTSINNMLNSYENDLADYDVQIVFVGLGARFVTDNKKAGTSKKMEKRRVELKERLMALHSVRNVKLSVCNNTLTAMNLGEKDLYNGVSIVPSGVVYIAKLQHQGFAYLKIQ